MSTTRAVSISTRWSGRSTAAPDVSIVSVMAVNNEVGTITDVVEASRIVRRHAPDALVHTDAVQGACWLDLREITPHVDLLSLSAHKFGGPKGVGVLVERGGPKVDALIMGGGQERERRSGTQNTAGIVATAVALQLIDAERDSEAIRLGMLRDQLVKGLQSQLDGVVETVPTARKVAGAGARVHRRGRVRGAAVPARRGRRVRLGRVRLRERCDGAVARACVRWVSTARRRWARCGCRSATPPPRPTSIGRPT